MSRSVYVWFVGLLCCFGTAVGQGATVMEENGQPTAKPAVRGGRPEGKALNPKDESALQRALVEKATPEFFPDWDTPEFDWYLGPIVGFKYVSNKIGDATTSHAASELGLYAGITGIAVVAGNPGFYMQPHGGYAWGKSGTVGQKADGSGLETTDVSYQRSWYGVDNFIYVRAYRHTLGISFGRKNFDDKDNEPVQSITLRNDFGLRILSWLSGHYTHTYLKVFGERDRDLNYIQQDHWVHSLFSIGGGRWTLDLGPGSTVLEEYDRTTGTARKALEAKTSYFLLKSSLALFWKLGLSVWSKYIYAASEEDLSYTDLALPEEGLNDPPKATLPSDSLLVSAFLGVNEVFYGLGVGWFYNLRIINMSEKGGRQKQTTTDNGVGINYTLRI